MREAEFAAVLQAALRKWNAFTEAAIRRELAGAINFEDDNDHIQFEICPFFQEIRLIQTEESVLTDNAVWREIPDNLVEAADDAGLEPFALVSDAIPPWLADRWAAAGGPERYQPAYAFFHGDAYQPRFDLVARRWCPVDEVWPDPPT